MKIIRFGLLVTLGLIVIFVFVLPSLWPIPPLEGIEPISMLQGTDSQFIEIDDIDIHYSVNRSGNTTIVLLHGFGSWLYTWEDVRFTLGEYGTVIAYDRPAFGLTERPLRNEWKGENPYVIEKQPDLLIALLDKLGIKEAILVGNSAGGTVAVLTALKYPTRVKALVLVDAAILNSGGSPKILQLLASIPTIDRIGPLLMRNIRTWGSDLISTAWHNPALIKPERIEAYKKPLKVENWDVGLWELTRATTSITLTAELGKLDLPVLVITGDDDRIVPTALSIELASLIPHAELAILENCGHVPQEECPQDFIKQVVPFINNNQ